MSRSVATFASLVGLVITLVATRPALGTALPECLGRQHEVLDVNNTQVLDWEQSTQNQFLSRGHIRGQIVRIYDDHSGHSHFGVQIGATSSDAIEVIYSQDFGNLPYLKLGAEIEACGDYITSTAATGSYPASPDNAILHWVHRSDTTRHESGYVAVDGVVYGY